jgi:hypothetical protein
MINQQMELGFVGKQQLRPVTRRQRRLQGATWWFSQMRQAVDRAFDWSAAPSQPAEQTWLPGSRREARV